MGWNLHKADLPPAAKGFLSILSSCGSERQAAEEASVSDADVRRWSRDDVFLDHRQQALQHFESWKDWKPSTRAARPDGFIPLERMSMQEAKIAANQQAEGLP